MIGAFPAQRAGSGAAPAPLGGLSPRPLPGARRPVLLVDDDVSITETVALILRSEGYEVVTAENGRQALERLAELDPAVVLLDMRMPVLDGWGVAEALAASGRRVPVVVMTAAENARRWADEISASAYLAKPFDLDALLEVVARFAARREH